MISEVDRLRLSRPALEAELKSAGAVFKGKACRCPFHDDKHPSAGIYQRDDGVWLFKCQTMTCGFHGDVFDVRARATGRPLSDVLKETSASEKTVVKPTVYPTVDAMKKATGASHAFVYTNPTTKTPDIVVLRIEGGEKKRFLQCSPVDGGFVMKGIPSPWPIYNRIRVANASEVVFVEGEKCVHALNDAGIVASTTLGGAGNADHADLSPLAGKRVILWPDNDESGIGHMRSVAEILDRLKPTPTVLWINPSSLGLPPKGDVVDYLATGKDPREVIAVASTMGASREVLAQLTSEIEGKRKEIEWPWRLLTRMTQSLIPGTVTLLAGAPGSTKSLLLLESLASWHERGVKVAVFELEDDRAYHLRRVAAQRTRCSPLMRLSWVADNPDEALYLYDQASDFLDSFGRCVYACPNVQVEINKLVDWVKERAEEGARVIAIDPITAADSGEKPWRSDSSFMLAVKPVLLKHGASLILVTHPKKGSKGQDAMDDLAGGAAFQRFAQTILWIENPDEPRDLQVKPSEEGMSGAFPMSQVMTVNRIVKVLKSRNAPGLKKQLAYSFDGDSLRFTELGMIVKSKHQHTKEGAA